MSGLRYPFRWSPLAISGCIAWLDPADPNMTYTDTGLTTLANVGDACAGLKDKSGQGNHVTQSTAGARPTVSTGAFGSRRCLYGDGGDSMGRTTFTGGAVGPPYTHVIVYDTTPAGFVYLLDNGTTNDSGTLLSGTATDIEVYGGVLVAETVSSAHGAHSAIITWTTGNDTAYVDGTAATGAGNGGDVAASGLKVFDFGSGSGSQPTGYLGDVIVYNKLLSATEIALLARFLRDKWGTP
jgi:hypothetical protein